MCTKTSLYYANHFGRFVRSLQREHRFRTFDVIRSTRDTFPRVHVRGKPAVNMCSNDYLGLGQHAAVLCDTHDALTIHGCTSGGTRNISGTSSAHAALENDIAKHHRHVDGLLFSSCYVANEASLTALAHLFPDMVFFSDAKNHASIIHGLRQCAKSRRFVFDHNDTVHLEALLAAHSTDRPKCIVVESVYSMDGDLCPLIRVLALAKQHNALLFVDEVHAVGLYGSRGGGLTDQLGIAADVDIISGTFSKAFGVFGGYITSSIPQLVSAVRSWAPGFIFTTSLPTYLLHGIQRSLQLVVAGRVRAGFWQNVRLFQRLLLQSHVSFYCASHIFVFRVDDAKRCADIVQDLLHTHGIYARAINYPTVDRGTERVRITLTPLHTESMLRDAARALAEYFPTPRQLSAPVHHGESTSDVHG